MKPTDQEKPPTYKGTVKDFIRLFSASLCTNAVQTITRQYKQKKGCQFEDYANTDPYLNGECEGEIEAAHRKGCERQDIIQYILWCLINKKDPDIKDFQNNRPQSALPDDGIIIELDDFLEKFKEFHKTNIGTLIIPLCHKHHKQYDK